MRLGIDISTLLEEEMANAKYFDHGKLCDPLHDFRINGVDVIRLRVWNDPYSESGEPYLGGTSSLENVIKIINKTKSYGYEYMIDFHYSDFWVDPGKQTLPKAWKNLSFEELKKAVYDFTLSSLRRIKRETNVKIPYIQIGNETTNGMLWPHGFLTDNNGKERGNYDNFAALLKAGIKAAREECADAKIIIHLEDSSNINKYDEVFSNLTKRDVDFDLIGMSYYPYWHGTIDTLFENINMCRNKFHKNVIIAELGYGFTLEDYIFTNNGTNQMKINDEIVKSMKLPYEVSPIGQKAFIEEFISRCKKENLEGVIYWEPLWIPGENVCWASLSGQEYINEAGKPTRNEWSNQCLFDYEGNKLPGFDKFKL